ncbi:MAG TPA: CHAD domain-containing protein [Vicinamibacterales bacterium]|jgi:CHAD domain-containing protein
MAFALKSGERIAPGLQRVVSRELRKAMDDAERLDPVHAAFALRKRIKKLRSILRLLRDELGADYDRHTKRLRKTAHVFATIRDADAAVATMDAIHARYPDVVSDDRCEAVKKALLARKRGVDTRADAGATLHRALNDLQDWSKTFAKDVRHAARRRTLRSGMVRVYRTTRKALEAAEASGDDRAFHRWRRRTKDHWYHLRLIERLNSAARRRAKEVRRLETWLGNAHNLVLFKALLLEDPSRFGDERATAVILGCAEKFQKSLRRRALREGHALFDAKPSRFSRSARGWIRG